MRTAMLHTLDTTTSHYLGGLALRLILGAHPRATDPAAGPPAGGRGPDPPGGCPGPGPGRGREYLQTSAVRRCEVAELDVASLPDGPLIVHVDLDVTDPAELRGLLFPAPGGPPACQVVAAVHRILATGRVTVLDIACPWHPTSQDQVQQARARACSTNPSEPSDAGDAGLCRSPGGRRSAATRRRRCWPSRSGRTSRRSRAAVPRCTRPSGASARCRCAAGPGGRRWP